MVGPGSRSPEANASQHQRWLVRWWGFAIVQLLALTFPDLARAQDAGVSAEAPAEEAEEPEAPAEEEHEEEPEAPAEEEHEEERVEEPAPGLVPGSPQPPFRPPIGTRRPAAPVGDSAKTRVESDDGVIVLSNRKDEGNAPKDGQSDEEERAPAAAPTGSNSPPARDKPAEPEIVDENAAHGVVDLPVRRSLKRKNKTEDEEGGLGWLWALCGAAALLLVPIGLLLNRGARDGGQPVSRYPISSGTGPTSSSAPPGAEESGAVSSRAPSDEA